jgi:hypothetical protein
MTDEEESELRLHDETEPVLRGGARSVAEQVFLGGAAMVGVCLTLMGLVGVIISQRSLENDTDALLAGNAGIFLLSCLAAYFALRTTHPARARNYMRIADVAFLLGMIAVVVIGAIVAHDII